MLGDTKLTIGWRASNHRPPESTCQHYVWQFRAPLHATMRRHLAQPSVSRPNDPGRPSVYTGATFMSAHFKLKKNPATSRRRGKWRLETRLEETDGWAGNCDGSQPFALNSSPPRAGCPSVAVPHRSRTGRLIPRARRLRRQAVPGQPRPGCSVGISLHAFSIRPSEVWMRPTVQQRGRAASMHRVATSPRISARVRQDAGLLRPRSVGGQRPGISRYASPIFAEP
ncbi:MAG: hypothetical protein JWQ07_4464 [Ramlibacter sp.]|nr:hypothetical protein [Ramlibacter sp.]